MNGIPKKKILESTNALYKYANKVVDPLFDSDDFFDANDLVQVKYEMLRKVSKENWNISKAAKAFGFSRISFYKIQSSFEQAGLEGLIPQKRGPRSAHKLTDEVINYLTKCLNQDAQLSTVDLAKKIKNEFKLTVHKRSIERALSRNKKKLKRGI